MLSKQNNWLVILFASFMLALGAGCTSADSGPGGGPSTAAKDADNDGVLDDTDNCPATHNSDQRNQDGDEFGDVCDADDDNDGIDDEDSNGDPLDNCPNVANPGQEDLDNDGEGDACDGDGDSDGVANDVDNCPVDQNPNQEDADKDSIGDACDNCPIDANNDQTDTDDNGVGDACENPDPGAICDPTDPTTYQVCFANCTADTGGNCPVEPILEQATLLCAIPEVGPALVGVVGGTCPEPDPDPGSGGECDIQNPATYPSCFEDCSNGADSCPINEISALEALICLVPLVGPPLVDTIGSGCPET